MWIAGIILFGLVVGGEPSVTATPWVAAVTNMHLRRERTVQLETGEMTVTEIHEFGR